jgi:hypothetical protein
MLLQENPMWQNPGYVCYTGGHLAQTVITAALTFVFVILCGLFSLVYYDCDPLTINLGAVAHGRADFLFLIVKTILVVFVDVFPKSTGNETLCAMVVVASAVLVVVYTATMPYLHHLMNKLTLGIMNGVVCACSSSTCILALMLRS